MKGLSGLLIIFLAFGLNLSAQTRSELEAQRQKTLDEITYVDNLLRTTEKEKTQSINAIKVIGKKLTLRENVILGMRKEIDLLDERIELNTIAINMMENDLIKLKKDYAQAVVNSYKTLKGNPELVYILSARDFNQGYKRVKYLQQVTKFRRNESEIILELKEQVESSKIKLEEDLMKVSILQSNEEKQKSLLQNEQLRKQRMVTSLSSKQLQLKKELEDKKRLAKRIEAEIARIIEEEKKRVIKSENTPEQRLIGANFEENKGRLPWPVDKGIITAHFGVQQHAVLKNVTEKNIGIEITSSGKVIARSVFQGEVVRVFSIAGFNMTVIIRHGKYMSVYSNILNVKVKQGDKVDIKQEIGEVYSDPSNNNSIIKFMIFTTDYLDPEGWLAKN